MLSTEYYAGIDVGSATTKIVLIDTSKEIRFEDVRRSGIDFTETVTKGMEKVLGEAGVGRDAVVRTISTGYGRKNVPFSSETKTEISCHAKGAYHHFPKQITIVDIGGQDNKIIKLSADGRMVNFKMNRKCAAGTGSFLEEIAFKMDISMQEMHDTASLSETDKKLNSFCTVFASTEILEKIRQGENKQNLLRATYASVVERVVEMDSFSGDVVVTGGVVEYNPIIVDILKKRLGGGVRINIPPRPQLMGAFGAALFALESASD